MRDYPFYTIRNRLAVKGEELVLYRFESGALGFVSTLDLQSAESAGLAEPQTFWSRLKEIVFGRRAAHIPAVCVPPGARLLLDGVPPNIQTSLRVAPSEVVVFADISDRSYFYREALLLPDATRVLLQDLPAGVHALVLTLSSEPVQEPVHERVQAAWAPAGRNRRARLPGA
ncbi:MAG TPA: hypothetical protein VH477_12170 [Bryobacteraceae bacterium]